jgi:hypothetical protein
MLRKQIFAGVSLYFVLLFGLAVMVYRASPAPGSQDILGLGIGSYAGEGGLVHISGRQLLCRSAAASEPFTSICQIQIAGKTLEIHARQTAPKPIGGICEAFYDGQPWPCMVGSAHETTYRFAYIQPPLGLSKSQLDVLRLRYFFENLPEGVYFPAGILIVTIMTTLVVIASAAALIWSRPYAKAFSILFLILIGFVTFVGTFLGALRLSRGLWD